MLQATSKRKIPIRRCTGCGEHFPKSELIRILRAKEGDIVLDLTGKLSGRGAYICRRVSCLRKARKGKRIESALSCSIPEQIYERMEKELTEGDV